MRIDSQILRIATVLLATAMTCGAQETDGDVDSQIEALRADFRADKTQLVTDAMRFTAEESKIFWPIYRKYDADLTSINDQRVALIKDYASKYASMTDADAKALLDKALNFEAERAKLKKEYAKKFEEAGLSGLTTAKFFQLEHRLDALVDVKLASELPSLLVQKQAK